MERNNKIVIMSIVIALIALLIIILSLAFLVMIQTSKKAHVENLIDPLDSGGSNVLGGSVINVFDGNRGDSDNSDEDTPINGNPQINNLPDVNFDEDTIFNSLDLDNYVGDANHTLAELVWNVTGNVNISISINNSTHVVTFSAPADWNGAENVTFGVTDPDGLYDEENVTVTVNPVDDPTVWSALSDQNVDEDSSDNTIVYLNITGEVTDPDSPITLTVTSTHANFDLTVLGNDLVIQNLTANWYGSELVTIEANGVSANFTLTVNHLLDDGIEICSWGTCYSLYD